MGSCRYEVVLKGQPPAEGLEVCLEQEAETSGFHIHLGLAKVTSKKQQHLWSIDQCDSAVSFPKIKSQTFPGGVGQGKGRR